MICDLTEDTVLVVLVGRIPLSKKVLQLHFERAVGLGMKETLPSSLKAPVPSDDINELVEILKEERDDRFGGVIGETPPSLSSLRLDFLFDLLPFRLFLLTKIMMGEDGMLCRK